MTMNGSGEPLQNGAAGSNKAPLRWSSCAACGGVSVPVRLGPAASVEPCTVRTADADCPQCETRRRRLESPNGGPTVWYDTLLRDWVLRLPVICGQIDAMLPLELRFFDVPWVEVYRAAADLAFAEEMFVRRDTEAAEDAEDV